MSTYSQSRLNCVFFLGGESMGGRAYNPTSTSSDAPPNSLMDSTANPKVKTAEGEGVEACSLARSTLRLEGHAEAPG